MPLAGHIGGAKTLLGLYKPESDARQSIAQAKFHRVNYPGLEVMGREFLRQTNSRLPH